MSDKGERDTIRDEKTSHGERKNTEHQEKEVQFIEPFKRPKTSSRSDSNTGRAVEITPQSNPEALGNSSAGFGRNGLGEEVGRDRRKEGERELARDHLGRPVFGANDIPKDPTGQEYVRQGTIADDFAAAEARKRPQVIAATVVALLAVVAILCTMIWRISHQEGDNLQVDNDQVKETLIENTSQLLQADVDDQADNAGELSDAVVSGEESAKGLTGEDGDGNGASSANATGSGASEDNSSGSNVASSTGSSASGTTGSSASGTTASGTNASDTTGSSASGTTASGTNASGSTASGSSASVSNASGTTGSTAARPSGANGEVAVSGQASAGWSSGSGTDQAGMDHNGESGTSGQTANIMSMTFEALQDTVTAKDKTNLRSAPSTASDDLVVTQIINGDQVDRVGINYDTGWSKLNVDGQTLYAVTRYLTTDTVPVMATPTQKVKKDPNQVVTVSGRTIQFTDCDDTVSAKIKCNLRGEPSTDQGNASIHRELVYGDKVHRTGISEETGWSRIEVDGEVLYAVSSYLYTIDENEEE
jgi:hypothetical protein